jgi:hypothetical protein
VRLGTTGDQSRCNAYSLSNTASLHSIVGSFSVYMGATVHIYAELHKRMAQSTATHYHRTFIRSFYIMWFRGLLTTGPNPGHGFTTAHTIVKF